MNLINIKDASMQTSLKESFLRYLILTKKIPHYKFGKLVRIDLNDLERWIEEHRQEVVL